MSHYVVSTADCAPYIPNQFELTMTAAKRARQLANGAQPLVDDKRNKPTVVALREIAAEQVGVELLKYRKG